MTNLGKLIVKLEKKHGAAMVFKATGYRTTQSVHLIKKGKSVMPIAKQIAVATELGENIELFKKAHIADVKKMFQCLKQKLILI